MSAQLSPTQRLLAWFAGSFALLAGVVTLVGTIRGTLDPGVAIAAFAPLIGGLFAAIVAKATADRDKDD